MKKIPKQTIDEIKKLTEKEYAKRIQKTQDDIAEIIHKAIDLQPPLKAQPPQKLAERVFEAIDVNDDIRERVISVESLQDWLNTQIDIWATSISTANPDQKKKDATRFLKENKVFKEILEL